MVLESVLFTNMSLGRNSLPNYHFAGYTALKTVASMESVTANAAAKVTLHTINTCMILIYHACTLYSQLSYLGCSIGRDIHSVHVCWTNCLLSIQQVVI